jgi:hypothetical protein
LATETFLNLKSTKHDMFRSVKRLRAEELILFILGIILTAIVFYFINYIFTGSGMIFWALVETGIMWVIIISLLLLADNQRVLNEELKEILKQEINESKTLKKISNEQLQEIKILKEAAKEAITHLKKSKR